MNKRAEKYKKKLCRSYQLSKLTANILLRVCIVGIMMVKRLASLVFCFFNRCLKRNQVSDKNIKLKKFVVPIVQDKLTEKFIHIRSILPLVSSIPSSDGATRDSAIPLSLVSVVTL